MAQKQIIQHLPPQWRVTHDGDCLLSWGSAALRLQSDGTIVLQNPHSHLSLNADGDILLNARETIHLNTSV